MMACICLVDQLMETTEVGELDYTSYDDDAAKQASVMMTALILLQDFAKDASDARLFLKDDMKLTDDEKKSLNWILQDPEREVTLDEELWEDWDGQEVKTTELQISPAWNWFCGEVKTNSICGLVFRLAITGIHSPLLNQKPPRSS